jgi:single-strand DNA-binding protein
MANLNKVMLIGNLTRDPELRHTPSGMAIAEFGLAVNRQRKGADGNRIEEVTFVDVTAFGKTAEVIHQYTRKGRPLFVEGHLKYDQWTSQDGQKRSKLSVVADAFQFLDSKGGGGGGGSPGGGGGGRGAEPVGSGTDQDFVPSDDDIPF